MRNFLFFLFITSHVFAQDVQYFPEVQVWRKAKDTVKNEIYAYCDNVLHSPYCKEIAQTIDTAKYYKTSTDIKLINIVELKRAHQDLQPHDWPLQFHCGPGLVHQRKHGLQPLKFFKKSCYNLLTPTQTYSTLYPQ